MGDIQLRYTIFGCIQSIYKKSHIHDQSLDWKKCVLQESHAAVATSHDFRIVL